MRPGAHDSSMLRQDRVQASQVEPCCRLRDPGVWVVADWLRKLPAPREMTFDNTGMCWNGCVDLDQVITDLKANVRFTQRNITFERT